MIILHFQFGCIGQPAKKGNGIGRKRLTNGIWSNLVLDVGFTPHPPPNFRGWGGGRERPSECTLEPWQIWIRVDSEISHSYDANNIPAHMIPHWHDDSGDTPL